MALSLQSRRIGDLVVETCTGRIVEGAESAALQQTIAALLPDNPYLILDLAGVDFIDSGGLGLLVRLLSRARAAGGDMKLCAVPDRVREVLRITRLASVFDSHPSEAEAIAAFYRPSNAAESFAGLGVDVLCVTSSADVLAYACAILKQAGIGVMSSSNIPDALTLLRASRPKVVVIGADLRGTRGTWSADAFNTLAGTAQTIDLPPDFSTHDAGDAARDLLERVRAALGKGAAT